MSKLPIVLLEENHVKSNFQCGNNILDNYLHKIAKQDIKRKLSACYVLVDSKNTVLGYYTLSNSGIDRSIIPDDILKKLPRAYSTLPVTLLGRLAVDETVKGKGYGKILLIDALKRSYKASADIASIAVIVDPIDDDAIQFYDKFGFILLPDSAKMFIQMITISKIFQ